VSRICADFDRGVEFGHVPAADDFVEVCGIHEQRVFVRLKMRAGFAENGMFVNGRLKDNNQQAAIRVLYNAAEEFDEL
jgi:hypothetical protein